MSGDSDWDFMCDSVGPDVDPEDVIDAFINMCSDD